MSSDASSPTREDGASEFSAWISEAAGPIAGQLSTGALFGYCSGFALQKAGSVAAVMVGAGFTFLQGLAYYGYVDVNWKKVEGDLFSRLDLDGDGEITMKDAHAAFKHLEKVLLFNLPAGAGFTSGLLYGMGGHVRTAGKLGLAYGVGGHVLRGVAATTAPALVSLPYEIYGRAKLLIEERIEPMEKKLETFKTEISGKDLKQLRAVEDSLRQEIPTTTTSQQTLLADAKLAMIEQYKKQAKTKPWYKIW
mmetsp:Transcript_39077/g.69985  ORF Transcript_39077/g.69985 Transcript_39077/m.69985 type:complete len:250 (-) Transcript_39077:120-869(-)